MSRIVLVAQLRARGTWAVRAGAFGATVLVLASLVGCEATSPGVAPPEAAFYTPVGVALSPSGERVYVVSSDFDLQFNNGWISTLDVATLLGPNPEDAFVDRLVIPALAGAPSTSSDGALMLLGCRGSAQMALVEVDAQERLSCKAPGEPGVEDTDCDRGHLVRMDESDLSSGLTIDYVRDPFATLLFDYQPAAGGEVEQLAAVGQLRSTWLALYRVTGEPGARSLAFAQGKVVDLSPLGGLAQIVARPGSNGQQLAAVSRQYGSTSATGTLYSIDVDRTLAEDDLAVRVRRMQVEFGAESLTGVAFAPDGNRAYAAAQGAASVIELDASVRDELIGLPDGSTTTLVGPTYDLVGATPILGNPSAILYLERASGEPLVVAAGLHEDALYFLAPTPDGLVLVAQLDDVGAGPLAMAHLTREGRDLLFVATFYDHCLAVVDVSGDDPSAFDRSAHLCSKEYHVAQRPN